MRLVLFFNSVQSSLIYFISRIDILVLSEFLCISENKKHCIFLSCQIVFNILSFHVDYNPQISESY